MMNGVNDKDVFHSPEGIPPLDGIDALPPFLLADYDLPPLAAPFEERGERRAEPHTAAAAETTPQAPAPLPALPPAAEARGVAHDPDRAPLHRDWDAAPSAPAAAIEAAAALAAPMDLRWARPTLVNPIVIDLSTTWRDWWSFGADQDVIFIGADTVRTNWRLQTEGGRNIVVVGGHYQPSGGATATLAFYGVTGNVYVEGVYIDNRNSFGTDGIAISGATGTQPNLYVQNSRIVNVGGTNNGPHGDIIQTQGPVGDLYVYNLTGTTSYQGLFISPQAPTRYAYLENVNLSYTNPDASTTYTYLYWFLDGTNQPPYGIDIKNVYAAPRTGQDGERFTVWPASNLSPSIAAVRDGGEIEWPTLPYHGGITLGAPAVDFAPAASVGLGYQSGSVVAPAQVGPIALADAYAVSSTAATSVSAANGVLRNDLDGNKDALTVTAFTGKTARGGDIRVEADGRFTYTPPANFTGTDTFAYEVTDSAGNLDVGQVRLTVGQATTRPNSGPLVFDKTIDAQAGTPVALDITAPLDADANALLIRVTALPASGAGTIVHADGTPLHLNEPLSLGQLAALRFVPTAGFTGQAAFAYSVSDTLAAPAQGDVVINVGGTPPTNHPPEVETPRLLSLAEDSAAIALNIKAPSDPDNDPVTITVTGLPSVGQGVITLANGTPIGVDQPLTVDQLTGLLFKPAADYHGEVGAFTYRVSDGQGGIADGSVDFTVTPVNDAPVAATPKPVTDFVGQTVNLGIAAPTDVDGDTLTARITELPTSGTVTLSTGASVALDQVLTINELQGLRYTAGTITGDVGQLGYRVEDGNGGIAESWVDLSVQQPSAIRIEAESMTLRNYRVVSVASASGGADIRLSSSQGTATTTFAGQSGLYEVRIGYHDTDNGNARLTLRIGGQDVEVIRMNGDTNTTSPNTQSFMLHTVGTLQLNAGTQIQIAGRQGGSDRAHVDYIELVPVQPAAAPLSPSEQLSFG